MSKFEEPKRYTSINDTTGDLIKSRADAQDKYAAGWDLIFNSSTPNTKTRKAIAELEAGKGKRFSSIEALMADLDSDVSVAAFNAVADDNEECCGKCGGCGKH